MSIKYLFVILSICLLIVSCGEKDVNLTNEETNWLKENKELKVAIYGYYPPYQFTNEYGGIDGVFIDYLELIESKIDYKFTKVKYDKWTDLISDAENNKIDLILEIQKTKKRSEYLNFYSEIFDAEQMIVTRKELTNQITLETLKDVNLVLPKNYGIVDNLKSAFPEIKINFEINEQECLKALNDGKYDAYIGPKPNSVYFIKKRKFNNLVVTSNKTPFNYSPSVAVSKEKTILSEIINKVDKSISLNEREVIFNNWLLKKSWPIYHEFKFWLIILGFLLFVLLAIVFNNRRLKKIVNERTKALQLALKTLKKSDDIKTNFIQNISHEIRTPMNGILGYSELLKKDNLNKQNQDEYVNTIIDNGKNLVRIIDNILEISNLQTNEKTINKEITNLNDVFENLVYLFKPKALKKGIDIRFKNENSTPADYVIIDKLKLIKILNKILNNAITFTYKGFVEISYLKNNSNLEIKVLDTGIGIENNQKEIIFDSFFQLENDISKKFSGLGLGLTIAKKNALLLGGEISLISEQGEGSTFIIKLPFKKVDFQEKLDNNPLKTSSNNTYQILVAEDEEINFMLVNSILSRFEPYSFLVVRAENGEKAVKICKENKNIDLVLMDIRMPVMDGYKATQIIKEFRPTLPIIAHTAYSTDKDILNAYSAGCDRVICKPIDINNFKETIINFITPQIKL